MAAGAWKRDTARPLRSTKQAQPPRGPPLSARSCQSAAVVRAESRLRIVARYLILLNQGIPLTPIVELFRMLQHEIRMRIFKKECAVTISDSLSISINSFSPVYFKLTLKLLKWYG